MNILPVQTSQPLKLLTIAGSDSSGAAGLQADLKTFTALGAYGMSVITMLTAQNTQGIAAAEVVPANFVASQLNSVLQDLKADAIKTGLLYTCETLHITSEIIRDYDFPKVIDPVIVNSQNTHIVSPKILAAYKTELFSQATLITPNAREAAALTGLTVETPAQMEVAASKLLEHGSKAVIVKGGRLTTNKGLDCVMFTSGKVHWLEHPTIETTNTRGTGCTLGAACATFLARAKNQAKNSQLSEQTILKAIQQAKNYTSQAIAHSANWRIGQGNGAINHIWNNQFIENTT